MGGRRSFGAELAGAQQRKLDRDSKIQASVTLRQKEAGLTLALSRMLLHCACVGRVFDADSCEPPTSLHVFDADSCEPPTLNSPREEDSSLSLSLLPLSLNPKPSTLNPEAAKKKAAEKVDCEEAVRCRHVEAGPTLPSFTSPRPMLLQRCQTTQAPATVADNTGFWKS